MSAKKGIFNTGQVVPPGAPPPVLYPATEPTVAPLAIAAVQPTYNFTAAPTQPPTVNFVAAPSQTTSLTPLTTAVVASQPAPSPLPSWLQGTWDVGGAQLPKLAIYGSGAAALVLLIVKSRG